jgi:polyisoprenoid-binding protein YceI
MKQHWKKFVVGIIGLVVVVFAASFIYAKFINEADAEFDTGDVKERLDDTERETIAGVDGDWLIAEGSEVGYRVEESINLVDTTANGRTNAITGTFTIDGTMVSAGEFTVDMTTFKSDESRRDGQFNGRIMSVDQFPTATFVLTSPIDFLQVPTDGTTITASASGDLTLRGVTQPVTFEVEATFANGRVGVLGKIPVVFADFGIPNPSFATITTEDNGLLEFILIFDRA